MSPVFISVSASILNNSCMWAVLCAVIGGVGTHVLMRVWVPVVNVNNISSMLILSLWWIGGNRQCKGCIRSPVCTFEGWVPIMGYWWMNNLITRYKLLKQHQRMFCATLSVYNRTCHGKLFLVWDQWMRKLTLSGESVHTLRPSAWKLHMAYAAVPWEAVRHMLNYVGDACENKHLLTLVTHGLAHSEYLSCAKCSSNPQSITLSLKVLEDRIWKMHD